VCAGDGDERGERFADHDRVAWSVPRLGSRHHREHLQWPNELHCPGWSGLAGVNGVGVVYAADECNRIRVKIDEYSGCKPPAPTSSRLIASKSVKIDKKSLRCLLRDMRL
jgi:hypothetical protein